MPFNHINQSNHPQIPSAYSIYTSQPVASSSSTSSSSLAGSQSHRASSSSESTKSGKKVTKRPKTGCLTCRLRKKRCDERKPICATCERLGIDCMGYERDQPDWLRGNENKQKAKQDLKRRIKDHRAVKLREARAIDTRSSTDIMDDRDSPASTQLFPIPTIPTQMVDACLAERPHVHPALASMPPEPCIQWPNGAGAIGTGMYAGVDVVPESIDADATLAPLIGCDDDPRLGEVWNMIFGNNPFYPSSNPTINPVTLPHHLQYPSPTTDPAFLSVFSPPQTIDPHTDISSQMGMSSTPDFRYLHHYLDVVLPLQYRFVVKSMGNLICPLAISSPEIYKSASSLAALHRAASRRNNFPTPFWVGETNRFENADEETTLAQDMHQDNMDRLKMIKSEELSDEAVILPVLFAMSYTLFLGGTSRDWIDILAISRRCLSVAFAASPEITGTAPSGSLANLPGLNKAKGGRSPWQRYKPLICLLVWMDIVGSVSQNKGSRLLPVYRNLLHQSVGTGWGEKNRPRLQMDETMGCDDTTYLAIAETVALSEWRDAAEAAGTLSLKELLHRAGAVEKILQERKWRESKPNIEPLGEIADPERTRQTEQGILPVMGEIFFSAAKVLLATVIHGPFPKVAEVALAVQETADALHRLDTLHPDSDVNRALIFPITIAGSHCDTPAQQHFFRARFSNLGAEAEAFGNSKQALQLLEEVWKRRGVGQKRVQWREVMYELGWESGILLI